MVELMGAKDVGVKFVGLHPAERLREMLFIGERVLHQTVLRFVLEDPPSPTSSTTPRS